MINKDVNPLLLWGGDLPLSALLLWGGDPPFSAALDQLREYHQITVRAKHCPTNAVITRKGLFALNVMPCRLCNQRATFQPLMECIFAYQTVKVLEADLEDLLVNALRYAVRGCPVLIGQWPNSSPLVGNVNSESEQRSVIGYHT